MSEKIVRLFLGLLVGAWVARYLGPSQYGELAYVLAFIAFFQAASNLGMDAIVVRDISRDITISGRIIGTVFFLRLIVGILCWIAAIFFTALVKGWHDRAVLLTAIIGSVLVFQAADTIDLWFQSQSQSRRTVIAKLVAYLITNGVKVLLIIYKAPFIAFALVMAMDVAIATVALFVSYRLFPPPRSWTFTAALGRNLFRESWPYLISGLSIMVYMRIDQIMISNMIGNVQLGLYAAAMPLSQLWHLIPMTISISLAPLIARKKQENEETYEKALLNVFRLFGAVGLAVSILTALCSPLVVGILYGKAYFGTSTVLTIYVFTNLFIFLGVAQSLWLVNEKKGHLSLYKTLLGSGTAIAGNLLLIPRYGISGAAIAAVIAQAVSAFLSNVFFAPKIFFMQLGLHPKWKKV